ncbi:hypothetical protein [Paraburkholderia domus]|uniref:hypothetical protein n=1 Tax=Paraburkholderia domus TaxID=2793075 RepID=UPI0019129724|nr:hypothetical protein [Paraburkholderia domus]MBK5061243.1 hypothetical protein [Burkholderia sp. R-70199]
MEVCWTGRVLQKYATSVLFYARILILSCLFPVQRSADRQTWGMRKTGLPDFVPDALHVRKHLSTKDLIEPRKLSTENVRKPVDNILANAPST